MCTDSCSLIFYGFYQSVFLKKEKANPKSKLSQGLRGWKWRKRGGENPRTIWKTEPPCPLGMTHSQSHTHTHQTDTSQLTHSTSLMNPSGSFNGDKFSRNPVIMFALLPPPKKVLIPVAPRNCGCWSNREEKERGGVVWLSDVVFTAYTAKNYKPRIVKVSFTGQICTKETRSNFRRSSGFIIGLLDVYSSVLRRFLSPKRRSRGEEGRGGDIFCSVAGT